MSHNPLHGYLSARGPVSRTNPQLRRLQEQTGYSHEHLWKVAIGRRRPSLACAKAIVRACRDKSVDVAGFGYGAGQ